METLKEILSGDHVSVPHSNWEDVRMKIVDLIKDYNSGSGVPVYPIPYTEDLNIWIAVLDELNEYYNLQGTVYLDDAVKSYGKDFQFQVVVVRVSPRIIYLIDDKTT